MNRNKRFIIGIAVALVLPLSFYIIAKVLGKDKIEMPVYYKGDQKIASHQAWKMAKEGQLQPVADLQAVNQFGDPVSLNKDLAGKMLVIDFFFTTCPEICPKLTNNMRLLENAYRRTPMRTNDTMVQFISISVDPGRDSVDALRAYAKRFKVDENHWWFLTGDKNAFYDYARHQLHLFANEPNGGVEDFTHSEKIVLLDRERYIRGMYNGLDTLDVGRCANDLGLLAMEKKK